MSPTQNKVQDKAACGERRPRLARLWLEVKSETRKGRAEVKQEAQTESALRRERKRKQVLREAEVEKREKMGRKPHFSSVNDRGRPYDLGAKSWRAELNKLCCALDPSVMDVRNQPHKPMVTLKKRLASKFEYSADIDDDWLCGEIGRGVSTRRFQLMEMIRNGNQVPPRVDKDIWYNLERISVDPKYKEKFEAMWHANSCRRTLGHTGPKGKMGIVEDLREQLGHSPDPDKIDDKMKRDKGYGGTRLKKKHALSREESCPILERSSQGISNISRGSVRDDDIDGREYSGKDLREKNISATLHGGSSSIPAFDAVFRDAYIQLLLKRVADLESRGDASNLLSTAKVMHTRSSLPQQQAISEDAQGNDHELVSCIN